MLQQTRVDTVIPYYERFLSTYPTVEDLARADQERLLKHWEGLGYYQRARNLHAAAKEVVESYGGQFPKRAEELAHLKGFGPYTSAAVASIAFGEPVAVVDGNVRRVLSRLTGSEKNLSPKAQAFLDPKHPADFNQAVMELGATVCFPRSPRCSTCPLKIGCLGKAWEKIDILTGSIPKPTPKKVHALVFVLRRGGHLLLRQRPNHGRWGGLWEFPTLESDQPSDPKGAAAELARTLKAPIRDLKSQGRFEHLLTHRRFSVEIVSASMAAPKAPQGHRWISPKELDELPLSRLQQKAAQRAL